MRQQETTAHRPPLLIEEYFAGETKAWGLFRDRFGVVRRQFDVAIKGTWENGTLTLVEDFVYDDGEKERRVWSIEKTGPDRYSGRADGVIGTAQGEAHGNALNWRYRFALAVGTRTWNVTFDDWLYLQSDGVLINRAAVTKFGFRLGEVMLVFAKQSARPSCAGESAAPITSVTRAAGRGGAVSCL